jgi:5-methylthioadenosine/S-adenosylhomocysteine deaminase
MKKRSNRLFLWGGTALTMDSKGTVLENALIEIENEQIISIKSQKKASKPEGAKAIDCRGCLVCPGFVNGHTHTGMTLLRGIADDLPLQRWLTEVIFPLEKRWGKPDFVYLGTLLACAEMIRSGTTFFNDMYYFEEFAAKAVDESGMRAICGQTIIDISGVEKASDIVEKFDAFLEAVSGYSRVIPAIAPHSIYGVSDKVWPEVISFASRHKIPIHIHLAEEQGEVDDCLKRYKKTPTEMFDRYGLWDYQPVIAAHAVVLTENDIQILGKHKVGIAHNPESNLKLGTKIAPVVELRKAGANVCLGTDSVASNNNLDLLQEADTAAKLQIFRKGIGELTAYDAVRMLTIEGAAAFGLADKTGSLEVGKWADVIAVSVEAPHAQPLYNPYSHLVYSAGGADVKHSVVGGKVLMENRILKTLDLDSILKEAKRWGKKIFDSID